MSSSRTVDVGPFAVNDLTRAEVVDTAIDLATGDHRQAVRAYALHVGGLNHRRDDAFVAEMRQAELVYADGGSIVALGRFAGASRLQRAPTTDIGWDILRGVSTRLGRPARLALIGGPDDLADRAGMALQTAGAGVVAFCANGYQQDWGAVIEEIRAADVDVMIIGLGAPREMLWVRDHLNAIPPVLTLTCGGWFGFLAGDEKRAGALLRRPGLEWIARLAQSPRRLGGRYLRGLWSSISVAMQTRRV